MKKTLTFFLAFAIFLQSTLLFANTTSLKMISDELNFELSQTQSSESAELVMYNYSEKIKRILEKSAGDKQELIRNELIALSNPIVAQELTQLMKVVDFEKLQVEEQAQIILSVVQKNTTAGASWLDDGGAGIGVLFVGVPLILIMLNLFTCGAMFDAWFGWRWFKNGCA
jgi:hypothetical protein